MVLRCDEKLDMFGWCGLACIAGAASLNKPCAVWAEQMVSATLTGIVYQAADIHSDSQSLDVAAGRHRTSSSSSAVRRQLGLPEIARRGLQIGAGDYWLRPRQVAPDAAVLRLVAAAVVAKRCWQEAACNQHRT